MFHGGDWGQRLYVSYAVGDTSMDTAMVNTLLRIVPNCLLHHPFTDDIYCFSLTLTKSVEGSVT